MNKAVRYYITGSGEQAVVRSVPVAVRTEPVNDSRVEVTPDSSPHTESSSKRSRLKARLETRRRTHKQNA